MCIRDRYQTYDVTDMLSRGGTLSVMLGPGWYKGRFGFSGDRVKGYYGDSYKLLAELRIVYEDGTEQIVGTDDSWKIRTSNIVFSNIYDGEWRDDTRKADPDSNAIYTERCVYETGVGRVERKAEEKIGGRGHWIA